MHPSIFSLWQNLDNNYTNNTNNTNNTNKTNNIIACNQQMKLYKFDIDKLKLVVIKPKQIYNNKTQITSNFITSGCPPVIQFVSNILGLNIYSIKKNTHTI